MDAPKCRICKKRHWGTCDSESTTDMANTPETVANKKASVPKPVKPMDNKPPVVANTSTYKYRNPDARRKYMRELMRQRRMKAVSQI